MRVCARGNVGPETADPEVCAMGGVRVLCALPYVSSAQRCQRLDLFLPEDGLTGRPLVLFVHGGGWKLFSRAHHWMVGRALADHGIATAVMSYRKSGIEWGTLLAIDVVLALLLCWWGLVLPLSWWLGLLAGFGASFGGLIAIQAVLRQCREVFAKWPSHAEDVALALGYLCREWNAEFDRNEIVIIGHSAGGHMALMSVLEPSRLRDQGIGVVSGGWSGAELGAGADTDSSAGIGLVKGAEDRSGVGEVGTVKAVVAISPVTSAELFQESIVERYLYLRPVFGLDPRSWPASFPEGLIREMLRRGERPRVPPLLLLNAQRGWDISLNAHADRFEPVLDSAGVSFKRTVVEGCNHFSIVLLMGIVPCSVASRVVLPTLVDWVEEHTGGAAAADRV